MLLKNKWFLSIFTTFENNYGTWNIQSKAILIKKNKEDLHIISEVITKLQQSTVY